MVVNFKFYHTESNPPNLTGLVGGPISDYELEGYTNELFVPTTTVASTGYVEFHTRNDAILVTFPNEDLFLVPPFEFGGSQYRKFWIKQVSNSFSSITVKLTNLEYATRYAIATGNGSDTSVSPTGVPLNAGAFSTGVGASVSVGTGEPNDTFPIWLRQTNMIGEDSDDLVSLGIQIIEE